MQCLESLYKIDYPQYRVIVVDNGSEDDSIPCIKEHFGQVEIIEIEADLEKTTSTDLSHPSSGGMYLLKNKRNYGFTGGNNRGMEFAIQNLHPDYLLLLNNDTRVEETFLTELVNLGESDPYIGFVGPKVYDLNGTTELIQSVGGDHNLWRFEPYYRGQGEVDQGQYDENQEVDFISGACMLVKTAMIREVGLFDEAYFSYREENDWCMRGEQAGWLTVYAYRSRIWHREQGSTQDLKPLVQYYMISNKFRFVHKFATPGEVLIFLGYFFLYDFWFYLLLSLFNGKKVNWHNLKLTECLLEAVYTGLKILF